MKDAFGVERVSKIAMRPVYHGTTKAGAVKLKRLISAKDPSKSSFKFSTGKARSDGSIGNPNDTRPEGLYTTTNRSSAESYSITGRSPDHAGLGMRNNKGRVMVFNSVGVKPKYTGPGEEIYDPKKLGLPVATRSFKRKKIGKETLALREQSDKNIDAEIVRMRAAIPKYPGQTRAEQQAAGRKKALTDAPKPHSWNEPMRIDGPTKTRPKSQTLPGSL